ncbi:MAG: methyltransferase domain-containing protein [Lentisphaerota bacterium]
MDGTWFGTRGMMGWSLQNLAYYYHSLFWRQAWNRLREPKIIRMPEQTPKAHEAILDSLRQDGVAVRDYRISMEAFSDYVRRADYAQYRAYGTGRMSRYRVEKILEHYVAADLLALKPGDVYLDIANAGAPTAKIYHELYGCDAYEQDLKYPEGIQGRRIGGDAANMPLPDGFASHMALHCSFEHFEGDADTRFIREAHRVLRPGGRLCILPLYMAGQYCVLTDPAVLSAGDPCFDDDAILCCARGWRNRHGRVYDVAHLNSRVLQHRGNLRLTFFHVLNAGEVSPACYLKFVALFEQAGGSL